MNQAIFDWNQGLPGAPAGSDPYLVFGLRARGVKLVDETLRDGLQSVSGVNPPVSHKVDLIHAMARVGVDVVSVGLPAAGQKTAEDSYLLCREIQRAKLPLIPTGAARTVVSDVEGIARVADRAGMKVEVYSFIGSSSIRLEVEGWDLKFLLDRVRTATEAAVRAGLPFCLVTEDTTRSNPDVLRALFRAALDAGASRLCLCDTTGHVTPYGVEGLLDFARGEIEAAGTRGVELDWHGHNDRGLAVPTALWAASLGVHRVHGTGLGVGERVGNASLELLVENLGRLGARTPVPADHLREYVRLAARALHWEIPPDHPLAGERYLREQRGPRSFRVVPDEPPKPPAERLVPIRLTIGGSPVTLAVHPRRTLLEALRYDLDLVGTKQGCDKGDCGACTVVLDGRAVLSCLTLAVEADGGEVQTVETLAGAPHVDPIVECFDRVGGGQCGFCTPGMLMSATALLDRNPSPSRDEIKLAISGNLCRCTGYGRIVDAVELAAKIKRGEAPSPVDQPGSECAPPPLPSNMEKRRSTP
jgi:2-isopropylmalate synthase